jgi:hypothetical protein
MSVPTVLEIGSFRNRLGHEVPVIERRHWAPELRSSTGMVAPADWGHGLKTACGIPIVDMTKQFADPDDINCSTCQVEWIAHMLQLDGYDDVPTSWARRLK